MSSNIDKLTKTFYDQLKSLTTIIKHNVKQKARVSSSAISQKQSLVVKTRHKDTRKRHHPEASSSKNSEDSNNNNYTPSHRRTSVNSQNCVQSSTAPTHRSDDKKVLPDEKKMNWNLKDLQRESSDNSSDKENELMTGKSSRTK